MAADLHKLAVGREGYYTREIARNREEYLSGHGESPGCSAVAAPAPWGLRVSARRRGSSGCSPGRTPDR